MTPSPAARRIRLVRRSLTLLFAGTTAVCLLILALIAAHIDASSRQSEVRADATARATGLARAVYYDDGRLHLEPLREDDLARGNVALAVIAGDRIRYVVPSDDDLPSGHDLRDLFAEVRHDQEAVVTRAPTRTGRTLIWAAAPVWNDDRIDAMVVVGADPQAREAGHDRLVRALAIGCIALVLVAAAAGHWLSGRATRPALAAIERQEQFLVEASHELRTPLSVLRLTLESAVDVDRRAPGAVRTALGHVDRLGRLVANLLVRARLESGTHQTSFEPLRLDQLVERVIDEMPDARPGAVSVTTTPTVVRGDAELLGQAVRNLVENAVRHGGGSVAVTVGDATVTVDDDGPGVPEGQRDAVFSRGVGSGAGTGSGLAIVRWVAELHHGSVDLDAAPGGGTRARLRLPPSPSAA